ncbi:acetyltransferase (GNAT) family protein [Palleronia aestuarii]|uniref:Acetyltransferase (GNAT) family protein n=1 Tax=Palleronia aestuarii TaxID=568105 RepID=A0A2W7N5M6_9RHOB|nr:GNAT family N-acetyltransferase [Palleronia aestuarii]PZX15023.1 acetyltransferase (GNAT) family protein [Palleronia aestuarii]
MKANQVVNGKLTLRRVTRPGDDARLWAILGPIFRAGDTYAIDPGIAEDDALAYWCGPAHETWLTEDGTGSYYLRANQGGNGDHVCNAGFATSQAARGRGTARGMLEHALDRGRDRGFRAMQFNFVVSRNVRALAIWSDYGFDIVGRVPQAFRHPEEGFVDALVLHRFL